MQPRSLWPRESKACGRPTHFVGHIPRRDFNQHFESISRCAWGLGFRVARIEQGLAFLQHRAMIAEICLPRGLAFPPAMIQPSLLLLGLLSHVEVQMLHGPSVGLGLRRLKGSVGWKPNYVGLGTGSANLKALNHNPNNLSNTVTFRPWIGFPTHL